MKYLKIAASAVIMVGGAVTMFAVSDFCAEVLAEKLIKWING